MRDEKLKEALDLLEISADDIPDDLWREATSEWVKNLNVCIHDGKIHIYDDYSERKISITKAIKEGMDLSDHEDDEERSKWKKTSNELAAAIHDIDLFLA